MALTDTAVRHAKPRAKDYTPTCLQRSRFFREYERRQVLVLPLFLGG